MQILAISGSLRDGSFNTALGRAAAGLAPSGVHVELFDGLADLPPYAPQAEGTAVPAVTALRMAIAGADALLVVTPEYNGSIPGTLKNAIDWASRPREGAALHGVTAAVAGASPGQYGAMWAVDDLRRVLGIAGARVIEGQVTVPRAHEAFGDDGRLTDAPTAKRLADLLTRLVAEAAPAAAA
jgi:chromate reductase